MRNQPHSPYIFGIAALAAQGYPCRNGMTQMLDQKHLHPRWGCIEVRPWNPEESAKHDSNYLKQFFPCQIT